MSKKKSRGRLPPANPVAKYAARFNRAACFADKTQYSRKAKHKQLEPCLIGFAGTR